MSTHTFDVIATPEWALNALILLTAAGVILPVVIRNGAYLIELLPGNLQGAWCGGGI